MRNTDELLEIVFERLDETTAIAVSRELLDDSPTIPDEESGLWETEIESLNIAVGLVIEGIHLRLLRYDQIVYDVELNFTVGSARNNSGHPLGDALHRFATEVARKTRVESYYCGLEPAADHDTRIFTGIKKGPYPLHEKPKR